MRPSDTAPYRTSARWRLTLSYAAFLLVAGAGTLLGVYVVLRYVPDYPLLPADPAQDPMPTSRGEILAAVVRSSLYVLGALLVVGLAGGWWLAGRVLRPLGPLRRAARIVADGDLDHRIRLDGPRDEFAEVADGFDLMLDRLESAFEAQQRFAANAAHELRTPLTVSRTILDVAASGDDEDRRRALERLSQTTDRAIELTEALLRLADANDLSAERAVVDVAEVARDAVAVVADEAADRGIEIDAEIEDARVVVGGDATLLRQMTTNLLQNGVRHNRPAGALRLRVAATADGTRIEVESDGEPLTAERVAGFTEPFLRGAGRTAGPGGAPAGHGLGLALVDRIVAVHRGALTLRPRLSGGLRVTVDLPAGRDAAGPRPVAAVAGGTVAAAGAASLPGPADPSATPVPRRRAPAWLAPLGVATAAVLITVAVLLLRWDGVTVRLP